MYNVFCRFNLFQDTPSDFDGNDALQHTENSLLGENLCMEGRKIVMFVKGHTFWISYELFFYSVSEENYTCPSRTIGQPMLLCNNSSW